MRSDSIPCRSKAAALTVNQPGPIEFEQDVLDAMSSAALSHVSPVFINKFGECIKMLRQVFEAPVEYLFCFIRSIQDVQEAHSLEQVRPTIRPRRIGHFDMGHDSFKPH